MADDMSKGTVFVAEDGRLCVAYDSNNSVMAFLRVKPGDSCKLFEDYWGKVLYLSHGLQLAEGNRKMIDKAIWDSSSGVNGQALKVRRAIVMDLLDMTFDDTKNGVKPSGKFDFYAVTSSGSDLVECESEDESESGEESESDEDVYFTADERLYRLLKPGDELLVLAAEWYISFKNDCPDISTRAAMQKMQVAPEDDEEYTPKRHSRPRARTRLDKVATPSMSESASSSSSEDEIQTAQGSITKRKRSPDIATKVVRYGPAVTRAEDDQDDEEIFQKEETSPVPSNTNDVETIRPSAAEDARSASPVRPVGQAHQENGDDEHMDEEDIDLEMREIELEQRKIKLQKMRKALAKRRTTA